MKILDLNIKLKDKVKDKDGKVVEPIQLCLNWIGLMIERAFNKPDANGRPTTQASLDKIRRYNKVMDILEGHKEGIVEIADDDLDFIKSQFNKAEIAITRDIADLIIKIDVALSSAKDKK